MLVYQVESFILHEYQDIPGQEVVTTVMVLVVGFTGVT